MSGLIEALHLETLGPDDYQGNSGTEGWFSIFGGHVIAQALGAASHTVPGGRLAHSLHAYFIRPGEFSSPIDYRVDRDHDGGSFNSRRVTALQGGKPILTLSASFHAGEAGIAHAPAMPSVPPPEDLETLQSILEKIAEKLPENLRKSMRSPVASVEIKPVEGISPFDPTPRPANDAMWFRLPGAITEDPALKRVLLAYASDLMLIGTVTRPHRAELSMKTIVTSLDHALWFHDDFQSDGWMLPTTANQPMGRQWPRLLRRQNFRARRPPYRIGRAGRADPGPQIEKWRQLNEAGTSFGPAGLEPGASLKGLS